MHLNRSAVPGPLLVEPMLHGHGTVLLPEPLKHVLLVNAALCLLLLPEGMIVVASRL